MHKPWKQTVSGTLGSKQKSKRKFFKEPLGTLREFAELWLLNQKAYKEYFYLHRGQQCDYQHGQPEDLFTFISEKFSTSYATKGFIVYCKCFQSNRENSILEN